MTIASRIRIAIRSAMAKATKANFYLRVRRWVDHDIAHRYKSPVLGLSFIAAIFLGFLSRNLERPSSWVAWALAMALVLTWNAFVIWRAVRIVRAFSVKGDRDYDQRVKFTLDPEHQRSESVSATSQRKRSRRRRSRG
ncbi:MAG: hypothetical protein KKE42_00775 [Alphaproteobacteria bacterium]|uniref:hypothetical protein n=1 Tax=Brevundimonas sp. TaxID=1871086 RepID=UPI00182D5A99|nr:hypothetical protein [Brevundimonas sp.]MBU3970234.1 hypothetical protein [Alphaproteobacteria bacterium]MBA3049246.1 hypothetical protein [Brevundimonas sp.]MBU3972310.1 hypothetical protein [Alphaproteobacteria bacterium]MBU4040293.1 hypothetical protein [Alphaproteobacteria bacterium]MBU4137234.1 hypothetical protein [Alphaproteobacteria bacterium]